MLDWQRRGRDWRALVIYAMEGSNGSIIGMQMWCEQRRLTPVRSDPNMAPDVRPRKPES